MKCDIQTQTFRSETLPVVSGLERKDHAEEQNLLILEEKNNLFRCCFPPSSLIFS